MALDPHIPAGLHSLPQRYNMPTRLWQVAFHQLLERMRHAVTAAPPTSSATQGSEANVLDHLIEFIQFAYTHYSQLFEDPTVAVFRAAWIEQLGDLARYRMAVAGLASRVHGSHGRDPLNEPTPASLSDDEELALGASASDTGQPAPAPARGRPADAASIGQAALNDWDLEEQETWREMAREWYALGLAESPGTGRLQHHLALLSKGDELRALYHYTKRCAWSTRVGTRPDTDSTLSAQLDGRAPLPFRPRVDPAALRRGAPGSPHPERRQPARALRPPPRHALHQDLARRL